MKQTAYILLATFLTAGVSVLVGNAILRAMRLTMARAEAMFVAFVLGSGVLASTVFVLTAMSQGRKSAFFVAAAVLAGIAVWREGHRLPVRDGASPPWWFWVVYGVFAMLYLPTALAPEMSVDGTAYYLSRVSVYAASFDGIISDGAEALFLFAFSIGKGSAAAMVELLFLLALGRAIAARSPAAAVLVFLSPIVAATGTIAAPDVMIAAIAFALFLCVEKRAWGAAALGGVFFAWTFAPWVERELARPALHWNQWFARLPIDLAVHGERVSGLLGPMFLLLPLALFTKQRRYLVAGLLLALPALGGMEARVFIPALPFFALALISVLAEIPLGLPAVLIAHIIMSWPAFVALYAREPALRFSPGALHETWAAALRIEPEDIYLHRRMDAYAVGRLLEVPVPDGDRMLSLAPFQTLYHTRIIVNDEGLRDLVDQPTLDGIRAVRAAGVQWLIVPPRHPAAVVLLDHRADWPIELRLFERGYTVFYIRER